MSRERLQRDRLPLGGDASGDALAYWYLYSLRQFGREHPGCRHRREGLAELVGEQEHGRVRSERVANTRQHLRQDAPDVTMREGAVDQELEGIVRPTGSMGPVGCSRIRCCRQGHSIA